MVSHQKLMGIFRSRIPDPTPEVRPLYSPRERRELQRLERACKRPRGRMLASGSRIRENRL